MSSINDAMRLGVKEVLCVGGLGLGGHLDFEPSPGGVFARRLGVLDVVV